MGASNYVHIEVTKILVETEKAFQLEIVGCEKNVWMPKSQIADPDDYDEGDVDVMMSVTEWIAGEKGIKGKD